jgi:hypothetical protein
MFHMYIGDVSYVTQVMFHMLRKGCFICGINDVSYVALAMFHMLHKQCSIHATHVSLVMFHMCSCVICYHM